MGIVKFNIKGLVSFPTDDPKVILFESCTVFDVTVLEIQALKQWSYTLKNCKKRKKKK